VSEEEEEDFKAFQDGMCGVNNKNHQVWTWPVSAERISEFHNF
jgi:hypothetical protein